MIEILQKIFDEKTEEWNKAVDNKEWEKAHVLYEETWALARAIARLTTIGE